MGEGMKTPEEIKKGLTYLSISDVSQKVEFAKNGLPYAYVEEAAADALAYIRQLEAQVPKWISVDTQMPKDGQHVLTVNGNGEMEVLYYDTKFPGTFCGCGGLLKVYNVTHWMPLPEPPKEG